jgi:hypothetical protein
LSMGRVQRGKRFIFFENQHSKLVDMSLGNGCTDP